jgi:hypothetical protein
VYKFRIWGQFNVGEPFSVLGNHFPPWDATVGTISYSGKSFFTVEFPARAASTHPSIEISTKGGGGNQRPPFVSRPEAASPGDGCPEAKQAGNPTVENNFPLCEMVRHCEKWSPTVGHHSPPWEMDCCFLSTFFDRIF